MLLTIYLRKNVQRKLGRDMEEANRNLMVMCCFE